MRHVPFLAAFGCALVLHGQAPAQTAGACRIGRPDPPAAPPPRPAPAPAPAAPAPAPPTDASFSQPGESAVLKEVTVIGRAPGPALWRVRRGGSEVVILGGLSPLPHQLHWDDVRVRRALTGARVLLVSPTPRVNPFEGAVLLLRAGAVRLPAAKPLRARLPPGLAAKFDHAVAVARTDPRRYDKWRPAAAGALLISDFRRAAGLSTAKPGTTLTRLARSLGVPVRATGRLGLAPAFDDLVGLPEPAQFACLDAAADDVLQEQAHAAAAAHAWADGRLGEMRAQWSTATLDRCLLPDARVQALLERGTADATRTVEEALGQPGSAVALVDLHFLLRSDGLLDRLRADGAQVDTPPA